MTRLLSLLVLAAPQPGEDDPDTTGKGPEWGKAAPIGLLVILLLCVAVVFLLRSFTRQLKKVPATFDAAIDGPVDGPTDAPTRVPASPGAGATPRPPGATERGHTDPDEPSG